MNRIKSLERSKLKEILKSLMLAYDAKPEEKQNLDVKKLSEEISTKVWQKKGKDVYFDNDFII